MKKIGTFIAGGLGYFWRLFALLLILCALIVQLGRMATPMVADYRQPLVDYLTKKLNLNVEIGNLAARWESLLPVLAIENLVISTPAGKIVLEVESALAEVDLLESLYDRQPRFSDVEFLGVRSNFVENSDGNFSLEGLSFDSTSSSPKESTATKYTLDDLRDVFLIGKKINLIDLVTRVKFQSGHELDITINRILLEHGNNQHRLSATIQLEDKPEAISLIMEGSGDPFDISEFGSKAYVRIDNFPTEKLIALVARRYWQGLPEGQWRREGHASVEAWLTLTPDQGLDWVGQVKLSGLPFEMEGRQVPFRSIEGEILGNAKFDGSWLVQLQNANMQWGNTSHPPFALQLASTKESLLSVNADQLVLQHWHRWLTDSHLMPEKIQAVLDELNPAGALKNVHLTWPSAAPSDFFLQANLSNVSAQAWKGAPAVTKVDGYLETGKGQGFVELNSQHGFSMHYTSVYEEAMTYDAATGQVAWWIVPEKKAIYVNSGPLHFFDGKGEATGFLYIDAPFQREDPTLELLLQIGIENTQAMKHKKYVPFVVSDNLRNWLASAVQGGDVTQGGFIFHGFMSPEKKHKPSIQLWLDIENAALDYQPPWPAISDAKVELVLDTAHLLVNASAGKIYNSTVKAAKVELIPNDDGALNLLVQGDLLGPLNDGWRVLTETPLVNVTNHVFDAWQLEGGYEAELALNIPLGEKRNAPGFNVEVKLLDAQIKLPFLNLLADDINGSLNVSDTNAVAIQSLDGSLWGEPLTITSGLNPSKNRLTIALNTKTDIKNLLTWAGFPPVKQVVGNANYQVQIDLPWGAASGEALPANVLVESDLRGLVLDLPEPLYKKSGAKIPFSLSIPLGGEGLDIKASAGEYLNAKLKWIKVDEKLEFDRGAIQLFGAAHLPDQSMLMLGADFQRFDLTAWLAAFDGQWDGLRKNVVNVDEINVEGASIENPVEPLNSQSKSHLPLYIVLNAEELILDGEQGIGPTNLEAVKKIDRWIFSLQNERIEGTLDLPLVAGTELDLSLKVLRLPLMSNEAASIDQDGSPIDAEANLVLVDVEPSAAIEDAQAATEKAEAIWRATKPLPPMHVKLESIYIKEKNAGKLEFYSKVQGEMLRLDDITGVLFGLTLSENPGAELKGASLVWDHAKNQTSFLGSLSAGDLGAVMTSLDVEKLIESNRANFTSELSWLGNPYSVSMENLDGKVDFRIKQGRFIRADASASNALMRLMGIFNFDTWIRRLQLDFSDVYSSGMAYDEIKGELGFNKGLVQFNTPVVVRTPSSKMQMQGEVNFTDNTINSRLTVNLPVLDNLTFIAAVSAGLPVAAGVFVASRLFEKQFDQMTSVNYHVVGALDNPSVQFKQVSDNAKQPTAVSPALAPQVLPIENENSPPIETAKEAASVESILPVEKSDTSDVQE